MAGITTTGLAVLTALRAASVLKREPGTLTPDGHQHFFTLAELEAEGRLRGFRSESGGGAMLASAARGLYKHRYVAVRTQFTVTRWAITGDGLLALAAYEAQNGLSDIAAAVLEMEQAGEDIKQAERRLLAASERHRAALLARMEQAGEQR